MSKEILQPSIAHDPRSRAFAEVLERLGRLDLSPLLVYRLATTRPGVLPWLAEQFNVGGVKGWHWATTDDERRDLVRNAVPLHRLKGTLEGYRAALRMTKTATLESYIAPPDMPYADAPLTEAEWNRFLEQMPQLRLYRYNHRGVQQSALLRRCFVVDNDSHPAAKCYPMVTGAWSRFGERPFLWHPDGQVEELRVWRRTLTVEDRFATTVEAVIRPGRALGFFPVDYHQASGGEASSVRLVGQRSRRGYPLLIDQDPLSRVYRLELTEPFMQQSERLSSRLLTPGYKQLRAQYDMIAERSVTQGQFDGRMWAGGSRPTPPPPSQVISPAPVKALRWNVRGSTLVPLITR
ncbi:MAG: phage tail protein [Spirulina sp.]